MAAGDKKDPYIVGMSYNSARDELFLADRGNDVVRAIRVRDNAGDLRDVYRAPHDTSSQVWSVCHMSDSDTLLVCSGEKEPDQKYARCWLVALSRIFRAWWHAPLSRNGSEWREAQRVQTDGVGYISCALSDSRVLIGYGGNEIFSHYMELFCVESGPRIARVHRIHVPEGYIWFSATCGSDTLVAMSSKNDNSVRVHRLRGDRLEEFTRILLNNPLQVLLLADRLLVADSNAVIVFEVSDTRLERRELIATSENIYANRLCAVNDGVAIFDYNSRDILHYGVRYRGVQGVHGPPRIKLGGPVIGSDPPDFFKNIKILRENKRFNNSFEDSSLIVTVSKHFSKFSENLFYILKIILVFIYLAFLDILTCIPSLILYESIH